MTKIMPMTKGIFEYADEVKRTHGRRLISVPVDRNIQISPRSMWFRTPNLSRGLFMRSVQFLPMKLTQKWPGGPYEFTPVKTLEDITWGNFTEKTFGAREQFSVPVRFVSALLFTMLIYTGATTWLDHATAERLKGQIQAHKEFYNFFINNDYRFNEIHSAVISGALTPQEARLMAYQLRVLYARWFANRDFNINKDTAYFRKTLIDFPLFFPLKSVVEGGVAPTPGYYVDQQYVGPLNDGQIRQLFDQTDHLAIKQEYVTRLVKAPFNLVDVDRQLFTADLHSEISQDPLNKDLMNMHSAGKITLGDLVYGIQENETWKTEFEHYATLHVVRLSASSKKPITLAEIQSEIKIDVLQRSKTHVPLD